MQKRIMAWVLAAVLLLAAVPAFAAGEDVYIDAVHTSDEYKDMLMDAFDTTVLGKNANIRQQLKKILYQDAVTVDATAYHAILSSVETAIQTQSLSENASLEAYTSEDLAVAVDLINSVCGALDLDCSIDPSNDSQNEYARVITIKKNGKVLGRINSDAKTDVANQVSVTWIVIGGVLVAGAVAVAVVLLTRRREIA